MLNIKNLSKIKSNKIIINNVNIKINASEVIALLGPSGGGKSTLLRCIIGIDNYDSGSIELTDIAPYEIGMIFQHFNLFCNMTLKENLLYTPIKILKRNPQEVEKYAMDLLERFDIIDYADSMPSTLSGGQKQRGAIARAMCVNPKVLLIDEPTSALDPESVRGVLEILRNLTREHKNTMIIATHEIKFAQNIADRVLFMESGNLLYDQNVQDFFGNAMADRVRQFLEVML